MATDNFHGCYSPGCPIRNDSKLYQTESILSGIGPALARRLRCDMYGAGLVRRMPARMVARLSPQRSSASYSSRACCAPVELTQDSLMVAGGLLTQSSGPADDLIRRQVNPLRAGPGPLVDA
jgi:hypothetical protein